ncbi:hypothetical protein HOY80DRAFT_997047 [Tuber brumale]|nr:hypothetical protein HOY80DRAFT_997047 [Tuber brumale]
MPRLAWANIFQNLFLPQLLLQVFKHTKHDYFDPRVWNSAHHSQHPHHHQLQVSTFALGRIAQNPNLQYVHGNVVGVLQINNLPAISIIGPINRQRATRHRINEYKTDVEFTLDPNGSALYAAWRATVRDQMCARNFADNEHFPNTEFAAIVIGLGRLHPGCDSPVTAHAAGKLILLAGIDEGIIQLVQGVGQSAAQLVPGHLPVAVFLLPPGVPRYWDPAMPAPGGHGDRGGDQAEKQGGDQDGDQGKNQGDQDEN